MIAKRVHPFSRREKEKPVRRIKTSRFALQATLRACVDGAKVDRSRRGVALPSP
jgi:hypothetical protein